LIQNRAATMKANDEAFDVLRLNRRKHHIETSDST